MQHGEVKQIGNSWFVRFYDSEGVRRTKKLGNVSDFRNKNDMTAAFQAFMSEVNNRRASFKPSVTSTVAEYAEGLFLPSLDVRENTRRGYLYAWEMLKPFIGRLQLREIETKDIQEAFDALIAQNRHLRQATITRVRSFAHLMFRKAAVRGLVKFNPVVDIEAKSRVRGKRETDFYSLDETHALIDIAPTPLKVMFALAAFAGLRRS